jgi:putative ABC transport system substrate-binding protein
MKKITVLTLCAMVLAFCVFAEAQQPSKMPKIGFLSAGPASRPWRASFQREFQKLGYVDVRNVTFIHRSADTNYERLPALAEELVRLKVDVIITPGSNDTRAAKNVTKTIPIVFLGAGSDPVALGLVDSLARPGGNLTGVSNIASALAGKRLELLKETIPKLSRVAMEFAECGLDASMERKPTSSKGNGATTSFDGGKQRRRIRERVQRSS